jgi:hypothetical protein
MCIAGVTVALAFAVSGSPAAARPQGRVSPTQLPTIAARVSHVVHRRHCRKCARSRVRTRKFERCCATALTPRLSATGETLSWTATSRSNHYVVWAEIPGVGPTETVIVGAILKPEVYPGLTAHYRVRARARRNWSNEVSITYAPAAAETEEPTRRAEEPVQGVLGEVAEQEARWRAEQKAQEGGAREAREGGAREAREGAAREARENAAREAKEKTKRKAKERAERKVTEQAERKAKEQAEREAREKAEREAREKAEREAREKAELEAKGKAEREAKEKAELEATGKTEREATGKTEREAKEKAEAEAKEQAERESREKGERESKERAEREAKERAEREAGERGELELGTSSIFTPTVIPRSAPEIANTGRGLYDWMGGTSGLPSGWPLVDYYMRDEIVWSRDLEPSPGHYSFLETPGVIDEGLAKAAAKGGRLRLRIMAWMPGSTNRMPPYIETETVEGQTFPKWNSSSWMNAWANLWKALGSKYGSNPRIGWIDTGGYGAWGEAHMNGVMAPGSHITTENFVKMVGDVVNAFPKAHVLVGTSAAVKEDAPLQPELLPAVAKAYPSVGFHFDNMGAIAPRDGNNLPLLQVGGAAEDIEAWERWKTAPVISEWWNLPSATVAVARASTEQWHVSGLGSGNIQSSVRTGSEPEYEELLKLAGFRDQLDRLEVSPLKAGQPTIFSSTWENVNVAPTYDPWQVEYELRSGENIAWSGTSALDLRKLLPTAGKPLKTADTFILPPSLPRGNYTLAVQVIDPTNTVAPMRLGDAGRTSDGAYPIGSVSVG